MKKAISDVRLEENKSYKDELPKGSSFIEYNGTLILAESGDYDITLIAMGIRCGGGKKGIWQVEDTFIEHTDFIAVPKQTGEIIMRDNDIITNRCYPTEWPEGGGDIIYEQDRITWKIGNRRHINRPPYWEIKGEHMGVDCDIRMGGVGNAARTYGNWEDLAQAGQAGFTQPCWAEGTITAGGTTWTLENAYGIHDKFIMGDAFDFGAMYSKAPYYWIWCVSESVRISFYGTPGIGGFAHVFAEGKELFYSMDQIKMEDIKWWVDPKSHLYVPIEWHLNMCSEHGVFDATICAHSRMLFSYMTKGGPTINYGFISKTNGRFFFPDGHSVAVQDAKTWVERGIGVFPYPSGSPYSS